MLAVGLKAFEYAKHLLGWLTVSAVRHQFRITQDGVERCAQFVAHVGEKLRLVLACDLKLPALVLNFVKQPHILNGDDRLIGKGFKQLNLLWREWSRRGAAQKQGAYGSAFAHQGNT